MVRRPRILAIGYNAWDVRLPVGEWPLRDTKCEVAGISEGGGGPGATAACAMARLGARVRLVSVFGDDRVATAQRDELLAAGVDLSGGQVAAGHQSPRAVILVDRRDGARTIFWSRGTLPALAPESVDPVWVDDQDLVYSDGHDPAAATVLARAARRRGLPVVVDAGSVRDGSTGLVAAASDVIAAAGFAEELTGEQDVERALRALADLGPTHVAVTGGAGGVLALDGGRLRHVPAFAVDVVDTTGAGDAFHAGYAVARADGARFLDCLRYGSAVAALKCRGWGGRETLPDRAEVATLLEQGATLAPPAEWVDRG